MITWGLCCCFAEEPILFRRCTAAALAKLDRAAQRQRLSALISANVASLLAALEACGRRQIGAFRINSELFPLATHPQVGYRLEDLPEAEAITEALAAVRALAAARSIRLSFHPDQFVVLNSPRAEVVSSSVAELLHQNRMAELCGAGEINLHGGGVYGDKRAALQRLRTVIADLPERVRGRLTLENDDRSFTVADLQPVCSDLAIPLVYDVHHHRINPDGLPLEKASAMAAETWSGRGLSPHVHLSSPALAWDKGGDHRPHADYIDPQDFPACWHRCDLVVDVEAKAKELAILRLHRELAPAPAEN